MWVVDVVDKRLKSLTQRRSQVRVLFRPQLGPLDNIGRFLVSLRSEQWGKLDQFGIEIGSFDSSPMPNLIWYPLVFGFESAWGHKFSRTVLQLM